MVSYQPETSFHDVSAAARVARLWVARLSEPSAFAFGLDVARLSEPSAFAF
jgi:hypothetical protein